MLPRVVLAVVLLSSLVGLTPLAYAIPPDPVWIPGVWDDNDYDDTVIQATSEDHITTSWFEVGCPHLILVATIPLPKAVSFSGTDLVLVQSRAPPTP